MDESDIGILAALGIGAYLIWSRLSAGTSKACDTLVGLPRVLCEIGWQVAGGTTVFDQDKICASLGGTWNESTGMCLIAPHTPLPRDGHGCLLNTQHWCDSDNQCRDIAQGCTPAAGCPPYTEWSPLFSKCIATGEMITCPDGSTHYPGNCPSVTVIPKCQVSECSPGQTICDNGIPKICLPSGSGCEGSGFWATTNIDLCKPPSMIVDCSCGKIDLNNPPGTTCETACKGYTPPGGCKTDMWTAMRACGQTQGGMTTCMGTARTCAAMGATIDDGSGSVFYSPKQFAYNQCLKDTCGW